MSEKNRYLRKGSVVTIHLKKDDCCVTPGMWKYDGMEASISRVSKCKRLRISDSNAYGFELDGVISDLGTPYTFTREMLE